MRFADLLKPKSWRLPSMNTCQKSLQRRSPQYLLKQRRGADKIHCMMVEDIRAALRRGDRKHARELFGALHHFLETHPEHLH